MQSRQVIIKLHRSPRCFSTTISKFLTEFVALLDIKNNNHSMIETIPTKRVYQSVPNDPLNVQSYTLSNGLRLFLSVNKNEPRIHTNIAVRAGSKHDPPDTTGLAHYMEHMLFKGTSRIGAVDWEQEKIFLERISDLYEAHRQATTEEERKAIYREIDQVSYEAAQLVAPNEYDKLASALGAKGTNAYTWVEQTVYVNDIPTNELERWMELESERFRMMALRLFHTELETVYEEFNIGQDRDFRKVSKTIRQELFPNHPYGQQTTIGSAEHLRKPSHVNIQWYFSTYYVPNNMAIILSGDFDPDEVVALAEKYFGGYKAKSIPEFQFEEQPELTQPVHREVFGQESPYLEIGWRLGGSKTDDPLMMSMISGLLHNDQAGLMDIYLNQQQKVLESETWAWMYEDYAAFGLYGKPREGQSLEEVEALLLEQIDRLAAGDFETWLMEAVIKDMRVTELKSFENNPSRVNMMTNVFVTGMGWERFVNRYDWYAKVSKEDIVNFVKKHLRRDNFVTVFKRQGDDPNVIKVEKPEITPVSLKREAISDYAKSFLSKSAPRLEPTFADFEKNIRQHQLKNGRPFFYVKNPNNELFRLDFIFEMGKSSDRDLSIALLKLPYLGTSQYSPEALQTEFFRLGLSFGTNCYDERSYFTLTGLDESLEEGLKLISHLLREVQPNAEALQNVVADILVKRENDKHDRNVILREAMSNYAKHGADSPFTYRHSVDDLRQLDAEALTAKIKNLIHFEHQLYYYGPRKMEAVASLLEKHHQLPASLQPVLPNKIFPQLDTNPEILFLDFPIVQADVMLVSKGTPTFNLEEHIMRTWYNEYFGYGLSSIVFQEIRESRALAYATYAYYSTPSHQHKGHYLLAYVGTQPDKLTEAIPALKEILENMPVVEAQMEHARLSILKQIESERVAPSKLFWEYRANLDKGYSHDLNRDIYERLSRATPQDLIDFHQKYVKGREYTFLVLGSKDRLDMNYLSTFGPVKELQLQDVFGY